MERRRLRKDVERINRAEKTIFLVGDQTLEMVENFKYLGKVLYK